MLETAEKVRHPSGLFRPSRSVAFSLQIATFGEVGQVLTVADRAQQGFFDASICASIVPEESIYALLAEHGERLVSDEDFAECYAERAGRPSIPPSLLSKVLLLAYRERLSDERAMDAVRFDLRWKLALDLPLDHPGFHSTTLVRFRARLLLHGKERLVFERSLSLAKELGLIEESAEQIVDSTPMLGAAATQETVGIVRSGLRKLIDAVRSVDGGAAGRLEEGLQFDYSKPREKPDGDWSDRESRHALLREIAADAERALRAVEREAELADEETVRDARELLREIVGQEFTVDEEGVPTLRRPKDPGRVLTAHDPEIRHGRKTPAKRFAGFKLHAAATTGDQPLLTALSVTPGSDHDSQQAAPLVDQQPEERRPKRVLGDTAYGGGPVREELAEREVEVLAPVHATSPRDGKRIPKGEFEIDLEAGTVTCPQGEETRMQRPDPKGERLARFSRKACEPCPLRQRCAPGGQRAIRITRQEELRQRGAEALREPGLADYLRKTRMRIERLLGLLVHRYGARKSRYLGTKKAAFQAAWTAVLVNLHPIGAALRAEGS